MEKKYKRQVTDTQWKNKQRNLTHPHYEQEELYWKLQWKVLISLSHTWTKINVCCILTNTKNIISKFGPVKKNGVKFIA